MLAAKFFDPVVGIDIHWELVPMPAPTPTPLPNPFVGMVFDPLGLGVGLVISNAINLVCGDPPVGPVLVNSVPAANTGTDAKGFGHIIIPPGTGWAPMPSVKPPIKPDDVVEPDNPATPDNDGVIITGSKTVHVMGSNWSRLGDMVMTCSEPVRLPSSVLLAVPMGAPVLVGGPPTLDFMAAGGALLRSRWVSDRIHALVSRLVPERWRGFAARVVCFFTGHPVDVATGRAMTDHVDFELPAPQLPLVFERVYSSGFAARSGPLGYGWSHSLDERLWLERGKVVLLADDGRELEFDTFGFPEHRMRAGDELFEPLYRMTLRCLDGGRWEVWSSDGICHELGPVAGDAQVARLVCKRTRDNHHRIELDYDERGCLRTARDSAGRRIRFEHDPHGRLLRVLLPVARGEGHYEHSRYRYDEHGDLVEVTDAVGKSWTFEYATHLLTRETDRTGLSFYFGYDGIGQEAWCVRTWGDGGIYDHVLAYDKVGHVTAVTNSVGETTIYKMSALGLVTEVVDPCGHATKYEYDPHTLQRSAETDPLGATTRYHFDRRGNCVGVEAPDGAMSRYEYDARLDLPTLAIDRVGGQWCWEYDAYGRLLRRSNPLGHWTTYDWRAGLLRKVTKPGGESIEYEYNSDLGLARVVSAGGAETRMERDRHGRPIKVVSPLGGVGRRRYDALGNLVQIEDAVGGVRVFDYDPEGHLVRISDGQRETRFTYTGYHQLHERHEPGASLRFYRDTEDRVLAVENEAGERHELELDARGLVTAERPFEGGEQRFRRDGAGRVTQVRRASRRVSELAYDPTGRLASISHSDGSRERFAYRADGALVYAANDDAEVHIERDELGRIVRERTRLPDGRETWVRSGYDAEGRRVRVETDDGHRQHIYRDAAGDAVRVEIERGGLPWTARFERDSLGLENARHLPNGVSAHWARDAIGRPIRRTAVGGSGVADDKRYEWSGDEQLRAITDDQLGHLLCAYDAQGRLARLRLPWGEEQHRAYDVAGNIHRSPDGSDRQYGPSSRLAERDGMACIYDEDGNLVRLTDPFGSETKYRWRASGQLDEVALPDGRCVRFRYDALGRRLAKTVSVDGTVERDVRWSWDGDVPIVEDADGANTTWVFEPETFNPLAKMADGKIWGVLPDHAGAPAEVVDDAGDLSVRFVATGYDLQRREGHDRGIDFPLRWAGQYEDVETGLYYNRWRYYSPAEGRYISPDPLGLEGDLHPYQYVTDPLLERDALGLAKKCKAEEVWEINDPFPPGSFESRQLRRFVQAWNEEIQEAGGSMTRRTLSEAETKASNRWKDLMRRTHPERFRDKVVGHTPDAAAGGHAAGGRAMALNSAVNSSVGGQVSAKPVGYTYNKVVVVRR